MGERSQGRLYRIDMKLLVIEDDKKTADFIRSGLSEAGYVVDCAENGEDGGWLAREGAYDVLIVDRMLPDADGAEIVSSLRKDNIQTPALLLTAMDGIDDRVGGLNAGADDYLVKPFAFAELHARVCSLARRPPLKEVATHLQVNGLKMDILKRSVTFHGTPVELQPTEFRLLEFLLRRAGQVVTHTMLLEGVWDFNFDPKTSIVETHISRLRAKLDAVSKEQVIKTIRGSGYLIDEVPHT